jgi:putative flippase GtrA
MKRFSKAQISSLCATLVDYGLMVLLVEKAGFRYPFAVMIGAFAGAVTNFLMNRHWSFRASSGGLGGQALRYALVSAGSLLLNTLGVILWTEIFQFHYVQSKVVTSILVGLLFNYPLHRDFVYRSKKEPDEPAKEIAS